MRKNICYILRFYGKSSEIDFVPHLHTSSAHHIFFTYIIKYYSNMKIR